VLPVRIELLCALLCSDLISFDLFEYTLHPEKQSEKERERKRKREKERERACAREKCRVQGGGRFLMSEVPL